MNRRKRRQHKYGFNFKLEYREYKKIGQKDAKYKYYTEWRSCVEERYQNCSDLQRENFKRYLKKIYREKALWYNLWGEMVPWITVIFSILISFVPLVYSYVTNINTVQYDLSKQQDTINSALELVYSLQEEFNSLITIYKGVILGCLLGMIGVMFLKEIYSKICDFLEDYIEIIKQ